MTGLLTVSELSAGYHGGTVLSGVSLEVAEGRVHAVVGHNGAGKSTLLSTIAGLLPASAGRVDLDGRDVTRAATHRRARLGIGYVPQGRRVFASITVEEHLAIAHRKGARWTPRSVVEMLPRLGQRAKHRGAQLSGGEQQMLAIARALVTGPRLLLLDEPTEGLAPTIVTQIRHTIAELARSGMTILLTAPQLEWPLAIADHISVLSAGRVTTDSTGDAARAEPERLRESLSL